MGEENTVDLFLNIEASPDSLRDLKEKIAEIAVATSKVTKKSTVDPSGIDRMSKSIDAALVNLENLEAEFRQVSNTDIVSGLVNQFNTVDSKIQALQENLNDLHVPTKTDYEEIREANELIDTLQTHWNKQIDELNVSLVKAKEHYEEICAIEDRYIRAGKSIPKDIDKGGVEAVNAIKRIENEIEGFQAKIRNLDRNYNDIVESFNSNILERKSINTEISKLEAQRAELGRILDSDEEIERREAERAAQLDAIKKKYNEQFVELQKQEEELARILKMEWTKGEIEEESASRSSRRRTEEESEQLKLEKARVEELQKAIQMEQENMKQAKNTTSQYYYRLRSIKMLNRYLQMANNAMNNFGKKAISVFGKAGKSITNFTKKFRLFHLTVNKANKSLNTHVRSVKSATKAHDDWGKSLKRGLTTILKYAFGIRSLYFLFRRLRGAMAEGMEVMATQYSSVNATMSNIVTSINQMKNALTTAIQPLTLVVAPILEHFANTLSNVTVKIASFFAAFTGQKVVYKAIRVNKDYIDTLKKQKNALSDLNKEQLAHYDMLNVIDQQKEKDTEEDLSDVIGYEEIPIEPMVTDWMNKLKDILKQLLEPLLAAWNKWKEAIKDSLKKLWESIKKFAKDFIRDFLKVWKEFAQQIAENILATIKNIIDFIRIIIDKIDEAWNHAANGYRILRAIFKIIERITWYIRKMTDYLVKWAEALDLRPLFTAIADTLEQEVVPAVENIMRMIYEIVWMGFLEIVRYLLEDAGPKIIDIWGDIWAVVGNIANNIRKALSNGDDEFDTADRLYRILQSIELIVDNILDGIKECTEATKEWSKSLDFGPIFSTLERELNNHIEPAITRIVGLFSYLYKTIILPMMKYIIEDALPQIERVVGNIVATIGNIADNIRKALTEGDRGPTILSKMSELLSFITDAIEICSIHTERWAANLDFGPLFDSIIRNLDNIKPAIKFLADLLSMIWNNVVLPFSKYMIEEGLPKLNDMLGEVAGKIDWEHLTTKVKEFLEAFEKFLEKGWETLVILLGDLGKAIADFVNSDTFDKIVDTLIKWMNDADPDKMAKGIENLAKNFVLLKASLSFLTYAGMLKEFVMTLINWHNNKRMVTTMAQSAEAIGKNTAEIKGLKAAMKGVGGEAAEAAAGVEGVGSAATGASTAISGVAGGFSIFGGAVMLVLGFVNQLQNGFNATGIAATGLGSALIGLGLVALGVVTGPIGAAVAAGIFLFTELFVGIANKMKEGGKTFGEAWDEFWNDVITKFGEAAHNIGSKIGEFVGNFVGDLVQSFKEWIDSYNGDWLALGIDIVKGILKIFTLPWEIVKLCWGAAIEFLKGFVEGFRNGFDMHSPSRHPDILALGIDIIGGILKGIGEAILTLPLWLLNNVVMPFIQHLGEAFANIWEDIKELGRNVIEKIKNGIDEKFGELKETIANKWKEIKEDVATWWDGIVNDLKTWWSGLVEEAHSKYEEIRSAIENKWTEIKENAQSLWEEISGNIKEWWNGLVDEAHNKYEEIRSTIEQKWSEVKSNAEEKWGEIKSFFESTWGGLVDAARSKFSEIRDTIGQKWDEIKQKASDTWTEVKTNVGNKIDELKEHKNNMENVGRDVITGLKNGLENGWNAASGAVKSVWNNIVNSAKDAFGIHSPSRVFRDFGNMIDAGLIIGVDEDADKAEDAVENLVPGLDAFERMYETIISTLTRLRQDAVSIIDAMIDDMMQSIARIDTMDMLGSISSKLAKLEQMNIPDIATGKVVSPQISMAVNADTSKLEKLLEDVLDKLDNLPTASDSDREPIVLQLDRSKIAEAVWDETEKRYKQTGRRPVYA